jgi:uncharacterized protein (UPF0332 family)
MEKEQTSRNVESHLRQASQFCRDAALLLVAHRYSSGIGRAYYAMFHAAQAILIANGIRSPRSHHGMHMLFGREMVNKGGIDRSFGRDLNDVFDLHTSGTYDVDETGIDSESAGVAVAKAQKFLAAIEEKLAAD